MPADGPSANSGSAQQVERERGDRLARVEGLHVDVQVGADLLGHEQQVAQARSRALDPALGRLRTQQRGERGDLDAQVDVARRVLPGRGGERRAARPRSAACSGRPRPRRRWPRRAGRRWRRRRSSTGAVIVGSESLASAPTMKRCAICLTPVAAIAATGRLASLRPVMLDARRALRGLARVVEQLVQVAGDVGGRRARRADVDEAEERRAQRGVAHQQFLHAPLDPRGGDRARTGHAGGEIGADRADRRLEVLEAFLGRGGHGTESSFARGSSPRRRGSRLFATGRDSCRV